MSIHFVSVFRLPISSSGVLVFLLLFSSIQFIFFFFAAVVMGGIPRWPTGPCLDIDEFLSPPVSERDTHIQNLKKLLKTERQKKRKRQTKQKN